MKLTSKWLSPLIAGLFAATAVAAETELTVYTAVEAEDLARYAETFNASILISPLIGCAIQLGS